jgi:hypothetical protein
MVFIYRILYTPPKREFVVSIIGMRFSEFLRVYRVWVPSAAGGHRQFGVVTSQLATVATAGGSARQEPAVGGPMFAAAKPTLVMGFA